MAKLDKEIKHRWLSSLRSGKYKQGNGNLISGTGKDRVFCCLGVLAHQERVCYRTDKDSKDVYIKHEGKKYIGGWDQVESSISMGKKGYLPDGMFGLTQNQQQKLAQMNDAGVSFTEIAKYISKNL